VGNNVVNVRCQNGGTGQRKTPSVSLGASNYVVSVFKQCVGLFS